MSAVEHAHHEPVALAWSGGKDSALALQALRRDGCAVSALLTTVTEGYERISMHGVRCELLRRQSTSIGVPLVEVRIPLACTNAAYEERMRAALASPPLDAVRTVAFGDLFLEDVRRYREERLATAGRRALFPLWGLDTRRLALDFVEAGFEALVCCVDPSRLDASLAGRAFDYELVAALPTGVDPCGENGEFHTFVHAGPALREPADCRHGRVVERDGFVFCDLLPA